MAAPLDGIKVLDLTKLARVSRPTFYSLYADKEKLFRQFQAWEAEQNARAQLRPASKQR